MATLGGARPSRRPQDSDFYQQRLKAWQPILTPRWVVITFLLVGVPFVAIGFWLKWASDRVIEHRVQYDGAGTADANACTPPASCTISFAVDADMVAPVYVYYELTNFYQNHRRYVKSRSDAQLQGNVYRDAGSVPECDPLRTAASGKVLDPCGLIANSFFNDTFTLASAAGGPAGLAMSESGISWAADRLRFVAPSAATVAANLDAVQFINETYPNVKDVTDEHFIVWMRPAALPHFRKLYGRFDTTVPAGTNLTFHVESNFAVAGFKGTKALVVSTTSVIGGKNPFLGAAYIAVGFSAIGLAALFALRSYFGGRRLGDTSYLVWAGSR